ncbi:MAG: ABC transporter permease subunit [Oscillospiraceae bacterium]|nr:ABC transporter permease subunit [Oscillospiraceae bacterium]
MSVRLFLLALSAILLLSVMSGCLSENALERAQILGDSYVDYIDVGARFATEAGDVYSDVARYIFGAEEVLEFVSFADMLENLRLGKVDAILLSDGFSKQLQDSGAYPNLNYLLVPEEVYVNKAGPIFHTEELRDKYNEWFEIVAADGTWQEIVNRWVGVSLPKSEDVPKFELTGENGVLRVCDTGNYPPLTYFDENGELTGFNIDMTNHFAHYMGMDVHVELMAYPAIGVYVKSGKADMSAATLAITDERSEEMLFGEPSIITQAVLITPQKDNFDEEFAIGGSPFASGGSPFDSGGSPVEWLRVSIYRNLILENRWEMFVDGLWVTLIISLAAQILGTVLGAFVCWLLTRKLKFIRAVGTIYCTLIRGLPIVVLLLMIYYIIFGDSNISNIFIAIVAFSMTTAVTVAADLKGAIETVDPVEIEAARSIGFTAFKAFVTVTLPQAVRRGLPAYTNGFVELVKATAVVGYIAIQDLTRVGDIIRNRTYDAYFPILFVAVVYFIMITICIQLFKFIVKKVNVKGGGN